MWQWINDYIHIEILVFIILLIICIYLYWSHDRYCIKYNFEQEAPLFKIPPVVQHTVKPKKKRVYKHEEKCREVFEKLFNKKFPSVRPKFLKNPVTGHNLELDGYCEQLKLAFEYDGAQHSNYNAHYHKQGAQEFVYQVKKDDYKTKKCKLEGIDLVRIPHFIHFEKLEEYIERELKRIGRI